MESNLSKYISVLEKCFFTVVFFSFLSFLPLFFSFQFFFKVYFKRSKFMHFLYHEEISTFFIVRLSNYLKSLCIFIFVSFKFKTIIYISNLLLDYFLNGECIMCFVLYMLVNTLSL